MREMFRSFFAMFTSLFTAGENLGSAAVHITGYVDKVAESFAMEELQRRQNLLASLEREAKSSAKLIASK